MNKCIAIISILILTLCFVPINSTLALHDDERIGKGGAWESENVNPEKQGRTNKNQDIDSILDKTFKKSPLVIPGEQKEPDDPEPDDPENRDTESEEIIPTDSKEE